MQIFSDKPPSSQSNIDIGDFTIKITKVSSLPLGIHTVRLYPLSPDFYEGADNYAIVQKVHWINRVPIVCRRTSWDYSVPDTQEKPYLSPNTCCICQKKFERYELSKKAGGDATPEGRKYAAEGKDLMEKYKVSSLVSIVDASGNVSIPIILRYGKELFDELQKHAGRIMKGRGINICDPVKGYRFDIDVSKREGGSKHRTYRNSMPNMDESPIDITNTPWKWKEICSAIKQEILPAKSPEEVKEFFSGHYNKESESGDSGFTHPGFQSQPDKQETTPVDTPPASAPTAIFNPSNIQSDNVPVSNNVQLNLNSDTLPFEEYPPCHSCSPNGSGFDQSDANCAVCASPAKVSCKAQVNTPRFNQHSAVETSDEIANQLRDLNQRMGNK